MEKRQLEDLNHFFTSYTRAYEQRAEDPGPYTLKIAHTRRVWDNMEILARAQGMTGPEMRTALAAALLHDIGRFPQYEAHGTFRDALSENHAALGVAVIREKGVLNGLDRAAARQILKAVALHNVFELPRDLAPASLILTQLLRDADKIDILNVMVDLYHGKHLGRNSFVTYHLPDDGRISPERVNDILAYRMIDIQKVKTLNDIKLLQVSWIFDLNFEKSLELILARGFIPDILASMPAGPDLDRVARAVAPYLAGQVNMVK